MPRRSAVAAVCLLAAMSVAAAGGGPAAARQSSVSPIGGAAAGAALDGAAPCAVTQSNGRRPPDPERVFGGTAPGGYGNDALWTSLRMWGEEGTVVVPATHRQADGALGPMKWSWYQDGPGVLRIDGRRLDAPAAPLRTDSPGGYGGQGFHPVGLIFPTGGCWEITGWVGEASLSFVTLVIPPDPVPAPLPPPPVLSGRPVPCLVTQPNGDVPPDAGNPDFIGGYGNDALWTNLWMWSDEGTVPVPASHVLPDGAFGPMKWAWYRSAPGRLAIEGHRLDAPAPPLRASIPDGYGARGFQVSGLVFPTAGCWEVTGTVGDASLTFVTLVVAPASRPD